MSLELGSSFRKGSNNNDDRKLPQCEIKTIQIPVKENSSNNAYMNLFILQSSRTHYLRIIAI